MRIFEKFLWAAFLISVVWRAVMVTSASVVMNLGVVLAGFYFYLSYFVVGNFSVSSVFEKNITDKNSKPLFIIPVGIVYALACVGLTFKALAFPG